MRVIAYTSSVSCAILVLLFGASRIENAGLKQLNLLQDRQIELMRDECREYQFKITTTPTYEDGYRAALLKRDKGSYADGFGDAKMVFDNSNNYAVGYHAAISQFGLLKDIPVESAKKLDESENMIFQGFKVKLEGQE